MSIVALIVAAGRGVRFGGDIPKQFALLDGKPILFHSIEIFEHMPEFDEIHLVLPRHSWRDFPNQYDLSPYPKIMGFGPGMGKRQDSAAIGVFRLPSNTEIVAIHDAVRPFAAPETIREAIERARRMGAAILAGPAVDTPKRCAEGGRVAETIPRDRLWLAQTPQVFQFDLIRRAYERVWADSVEVSDDAAAVERLGYPVEIVQSLRPNPKITTPEDLRFAEWILREGKQS